VIAYVDESLRLDGEGRYVLAAVLVPDARADEVRAVLRSTLRRGQRRYHWHDEGPASRIAIATLVRELRLDAVVVTVTPLTVLARSEPAGDACQCCCGRSNGEGSYGSSWKAGIDRSTPPTTG
jgi:hypothetical protein